MASSRGIRNPTVTVVQLLANALKVPTWRLMEEQDGAPSGNGAG